MIVIAKNTEKKLLQELALCKRVNRSPQCYFLPLSQLAELPKEEIFVQLLTLFHQVPNSYTAQIFICADRDTFILISDLTKERFSEFLDEFVTAIGKKDFARKAEIYDIGRDFDTLATLAKDKTAQVEAAVAEAQRKGQLEQARLLIEEMEQVNPAMLQTFQSRRAERVGGQILVVDDDQLCRSMASNALGKRYSCAIAKNAKDALREYILLAPDVLFLDIGLPDINGFDLLDHLFSIDPHAYVIMFSGRKDKENILKALEMGAQGFVGKPFTGNQLLEYVKKSPFIREKEERDQQSKKGVA